MTGLLPVSEVFRSHPAQWWHFLQDGRLQCDLCPRQCRLNEGERGHCFVRARISDRMVLTSYGRGTGFRIEHIEKKPLYHFYPGSRVLCFGTSGCNLSCRFCSEGTAIKTCGLAQGEVLASPEQIALMAEDQGVESVAFSDSDPVIFAEYAMDIANACHARGIKTVASTAGYIHSEPREAFFRHMDAANIDLKAFTDAFYVQQTGSQLSPVLETLLHVYHESNCWLEITTLLIPGLNDNPVEIDAMTQWLYKYLGPEVPLHFTAFHPAGNLDRATPTPISTLKRAQKIAADNGLTHVYLGNVHVDGAGNTHCENCKRTLIERDHGRLAAHHLMTGNACPDCGLKLKGRFEKTPALNACGSPDLAGDPLGVYPRGSLAHRISATFR